MRSLTVPKVVTPSKLKKIASLSYEWLKLGSQDSSAKQSIYSDIFNIFSLLQFCARLPKTSYKWATCAFLPDPFLQFTCTENSQIWIQVTFCLTNYTNFVVESQNNPIFFSIFEVCLLPHHGWQPLLFHTEREAHLFLRFLYITPLKGLYCSQKILPDDLVGITHPFSAYRTIHVALTSVFLKLQRHCNILFFLRSIRSYPKEYWVD